MRLILASRMYSLQGVLAVKIAVKPCFGPAVRLPRLLFYLQWNQKQKAENHSTMRCNFNPFLIVGILVISFASSTLLAINQQRGNNNSKNAKSTQERRDDAKIKSEQEDVSQAQNRLQTDSKEFRQAEAEAQKSLVAVVEAKKAYETTEERTEETHGRRLGLANAMTLESAAQSAFENGVQPVLLALQQQVEYRNAANSAKAAEQELTQLTKNQSLSPTDRELQSKAAQVDIKRVKTMEQEAIVGVPETRKLKEQRDAAIQKLAQLRAEIRAAVSASSEVQAAELKWEKAKKSHEKDLAQVVGMKKKFAADQAKLAAEKVQLQKANMQDKANDQKTHGNQKNNK